MKKLESRQEILDYLKEEQEKIMDQMKKNLKEREGNHTTDESVKLVKDFELLLERNNAFRDIQYKILGIGE